MNKAFLKTLVKVEPDYNRIFSKLYEGVVETNKLIGIGLNDITEEQRISLMDTYLKLRVEEGKEVAEAIEKEDKVNLLNELIDVLVVTGYEYYLKERKVWNYTDYMGSRGLQCCLENIITYSSMRFCSLSTLTTTQDVLICMNCDLEKAVDEVLRANLSKFPTIEELAMCGCLWSGSDYETLIEEQMQLLENGGRYTGVTAEPVVDSKGETRYVFWSEKEYGVPKRKYLKPESFIPADLQDCF